MGDEERLTRLRQVFFPGRQEASDAEAGRRTEAAAAWVRETFAAARERSARAVIIAFHASLGLEDPYRRPFEPLLGALQQEAERFGRPVALMHGDDHEYTVDRPLSNRETGKRLENVTRMEVPGSPYVGWVRVTVTPEAEQPFEFDAHVLPRWLLW